MGNLWFSLFGVCINIQDSCGWRSAQTYCGVFCQCDFCIQGRTETEGIHPSATPRSAHSSLRCLLPFHRKFCFRRTTRTDYCHSRCYRDFCILFYILYLLVLVASSVIYIVQSIQLSSSWLLGCGCWLMSDVWYEWWVWSSWTYYYSYICIMWFRCSIMSWGCMRHETSDWVSSCSC